MIGGSSFRREDSSGDGLWRPSGVRRSKVMLRKIGQALA
jgi:hypothetical protein